jgi:hypothetical protein
MKHEDKVETKRREYVSEYDGKTYTEAIFSIRELYGYGAVIFKGEPLEVTATIEKNSDTAYYYYDFGMEDRVSVTKTPGGFLYDPDPVQTVLNAVKFDLQHAFNHIDMDPNFGHVHWALRAILKDRVIAYDWWEEEEVPQQTEFNFMSESS